MSCNSWSKAIVIAMSSKNVSISSVVFPYLAPYNAMLAQMQNQEQLSS